MDSPENLQFVDVHTLGRVLFLYTDLEKISFKNVHFHQTRHWFFNRESLADERTDELFPEGTKDECNVDYYNHIEILYRQLKINFETQRDYARAGDFHYGELEMQHKTKILK